MLVVHVHVRVRPEHLEAFLAQTRRNAAASLDEPGVRRFDVPQQEGEPAHVRDAVAGMIAEPRASTRFDALFPAEDGW
jgi:autoinducer 2-degrading protein